jgi:hypothetical protein
MKLRIKENSLRFRLTRSEVDCLVREGNIEQKTEFGPESDGEFIYELRASSEISRIQAELGDRRISVLIPSENVRNWASSEVVGLEERQEIGDGKSLCILVEKDFACLEKRDGEDESDSFPHREPAKNSNKTCR